MHRAYTWKFFAITALLVVIWRLYALQTFDSQERLTDTEIAADTSGALFKELLTHDLLKPNAAGLLELPTPDQALAEEQHTGKRPAYAAALHKLYETPQGKEIQKQVHLWNLGHQFAAIRDNRPDTSDTNRWKVSDGKTGRMLDSVALLPAEFIYVGGETLRGGFHDWRTSRNGKDTPLVFSTEIHNQEEKSLTWNVQIIGAVDQQTLISRLATYQPRLEPRRPSDVCDDVPTQAWELVLTIPPKHTVSIEIPVSMVYSDTLRLDGVAICMTKPGAVLPPGVSDACLAKPPQQHQADNAVSNEIASEDDDTTQVESEVLARRPRECHRPAALAQYTLHWQAQRLYTRGRSNSTAGSTASYTIYTLDTHEQGKPPQGEALTAVPSDTQTAATQCQQTTDPIGTPTDKTTALGLLPLIGQDRYDRYSLSGILNASRLEARHTTVHLTINSRMQAIAQQSLKAAVAAQKHKGATGALVLLNPQTGAILAAANVSPQSLPADIHHWDRNAFSQIYPTQDPTQFNPWQGATGFNAPASTFKLVTALAGLMAIRDGHQDSARLEKMMAGVERDVFEQVTGLKPDADDFSHPELPRTKENTPSVIRNDHPGLLAGAFAKHSKECGKANKVGVCEALRDSANNWFMQLALNMDYSANAGAIQQLSATAKLLGFQGSAYLVPESLKLTWIKPRNGGRGDVLNAFGGHMSIQATPLGKIPPLVQLVFNSIGQDMAASPLQLAKLSASIATGNNVQPHLFALWNGRDLYAKGDYPEAAALDLPHLDWVQAGMKAVVNNGTAAKKLGEFAPFVYGKTGTAQATPKGEPKQLSAWFTGFYTPIEGKPEAATLAFTCQITRSNTGGGAVCAPVIRNVLEALQQANLLESRHAN